MLRFSVESEPKCCGNHPLRIVDSEVLASSLVQAGDDVSTNFLLLINMSSFSTESPAAFRG